MTMCNVMWGSHACDLPLNHPEEKHLCGANFEEDDKDALPGDWTGPCSRLRIDADGIGWIEHWGYDRDDPEKRGYWSEESRDFPWAYMSLPEPPPPAPSPELRAALCQGGRITVGTVTYACSGSAHISGYRVLCTSQGHQMPALPWIVGSTITIGPGRTLVISAIEGAR